MLSGPVSLFGPIFTPKQISLLTLLNLIFIFSTPSFGKPKLLSNDSSLISL